MSQSLPKRAENPKSGCPGGGSRDRLLRFERPPMESSGAAGYHMSCPDMAARSRVQLLLVGELRPPHHPAILVGCAPGTPCILVGCAPPDPCDSGGSAPRTLCHFRRGHGRGLPRWRQTRVMTNHQPPDPWRLRQQPT